MTESTETTPRIRWTRSQRFQLSETGRTAGDSYREVIVASRAESGRQSFDAARAAWATQSALEPSDGLYLGELKEGPRTMDEITRALEGCGPKRQDVRDALERLIKVRMLELVEPPPPPPPPMRRW